MPPERDRLSLLEVLSETGFQASVIATYCCYFPFYEEVVLRRLLDRGCTNNILLMDATRCAEAFAHDDTRPRRAGRDYTLVPVDLHGAFHPKLIVAVGKAKGALFVGSHNMTLAGFGLNDEITNEFRVGAGDRQAGELVREALDYLRHFLPANLPDVKQVFEAVRRSVPWLEGPIPVAAKDRILLTTTGQDQDLWSRLRPLIPTRPSMAFACGPFFDKKLRFLQAILDEVKPRKLLVGIDPESVEIDAESVRAFRGAHFVNIGRLPRVQNRRESGSRYLHAKVLWFTGSEGELVVTGSANPSAPAFLSGDGFRNAEVIVADRRAGAAKALGLRELVAAEGVETDDWRRVEARQDGRSGGDEKGSSGTALLATPSDDGFQLERSIGKAVSLDALAPGGGLLGQALTSRDDPTQILAPPDIRDGAFSMRGFETGRRPVTILIHRPDEVAKNVGGDRQRELRRALGALEEDPAQLDALLKLTEKVIFDSDDVVIAESRAHRKGDNHRREERSASGPESLAVDASGRRTGRRKKRLASGDILVLLDALMYRLGEGLTSQTAVRLLDEDRQPAERADIEGEDSAPPVSHDVLAETCRRKVGRLIRRMGKQLALAHSSSSRRAVVQLAAVLSVVHTLRTMEQRTEWRSKHLRLVDAEHEWELLEQGTLALGWGSEALRSRALQEGDREPFQELSLAAGLLAWLVWDVHIDVGAALDRTTTVSSDEEDDLWYPVQVFATVALLLADDEDAQSTLSAAVGRTARRTIDAGSWLHTHLAFARRVRDLTDAPDAVKDTPRPPRPGDLAILGPTVDPRVRVVLDVVPSGESPKIGVFDEDADGQKRYFLATYIRCVPWEEGGTVQRVMRVG